MMITTQRIEGDVGLRRGHGRDDYWKRGCDGMEVRLGTGQS
jgi:hypothetical protein